MKRFLPLMILPVLGLLAAPAVAQAGRCARNSLGETSCAREENGTAVLNGLGEVVCAPGACVRESETAVAWSCSSVPGGSARFEVGEGPVCEGGCIEPEQTRCVPMGE